MLSSPKDLSENCLEEICRNGDLSSIQNYFKTNKIHHDDCIKGFVIAVKDNKQDIALFIGQHLGPFNAFELFNAINSGLLLIVLSGNLVATQSFIGSEHLSAHTLEFSAYIAAVTGQVEIALLLLEDDRISSPKLKSRIVVEICFAASIEIFEHLLANTNSNLIILAKLFDRAISTKHLGIVKALLHGSRVATVAPMLDWGVGLACYLGEQEIVEELLLSDLINEAALIQGFEDALDQGHDVVVNLLLNDWRLKSPKLKTRILPYACVLGSAQLVERLIIEGADPAAYESLSIRVAVGRRKHKIAKFLLEKTNVNPSENEHEAICTAIRNGDTDMVKLLLLDKRLNTDPIPILLFELDPCEQDEMVKLLMEHGRIGPITKRRILEVAIRDEIPELAWVLLQDPEVWNKLNFSDIVSMLESVNRLGYIKLVQRLIQHPRFKNVKEFNSIAAESKYIMESLGIPIHYGKSPFRCKVSPFVANFNNVGKLRNFTA